MGFCLLNHVAVGASYALAHYGLERIAILDIDVHHGNGTESYVRQEPRVMFISNFESGIYPFTENQSDLANQLCEGRIISTLEGGYDLTALGLSVVAHVKTLANL